MGVDVLVEQTIGRPRSEVAQVATDPARDPEWIGGIKEARELTESPLGVGSRAQRVATFLGRRIEYVLEVVEFERDSLLVMKSIKGPFPMKVTYRFHDAAEGTRMSIRVEGDATGFFRIAAPLLAQAVRRNVSKDLLGLKSLLESGN